ncbi:ATP-dependent DNA helicase [Georgenia sp. Z1344]|uniref:ATP-dependent DNA helicase n=1 Tax=Georgenia sp. Z1344 TaxID=3416706 RepID=UPI003CE9846B
MSVTEEEAGTDREGTGRARSATTTTDDGGSDDGGADEARPGRTGDASGSDDEERALSVLDAVVERAGGTPRDGQREMTRRVAGAVAGGERLLVQAGTGTGKSFGYLAPVMSHAVASGERAVVSTATLALQRQVLVKDAPAVADAIQGSTGTRPDVALLKGWHNYVCRHKVDGGYPAEEEPTLLAAPATTASTGQGARGPLGEQVVRAREFAASSETGDRDELVPGVSDRAWRQVSVTRLECIGRSCPQWTDCFAVQARERAAQADVVVTNHAMLGIAATGSPGVLPEHDVLVVDEAHELAGRLRSQGTVELSVGVVERVARVVRAENGAAEDLTRAAGDLRGALEVLPAGRMADGPGELLGGVISLVGSAATEAARSLAGEAGSPDKAGGRVAARSAAVVLAEVCERLVSGGVAARADVMWCDRGREDLDPPRLQLAPVEVADRAATHLWADRAVVATSATLTLGGELAPLAVQLGLSRGAQWQGADVGSPFSYGSQAILYTPAHLPAPGRDGTAEAARTELVDLVEASGGGALGLFSSRRAAEEAAEVVRDRTGLRVLCQGDDSLPALVEAFAADDDACLFGTISLWQGVDVPGRANRLVVIDRIPFPRPDDPVAQARSEVAQSRGASGFMAVSATHAALLLAQGVGRLIRSTTDRGVVAVLDPRLVTARYGGYLRASLPPMWPTRDGEVARAALRRLAAAE